MKMPFIILFWVVLLPLHTRQNSLNVAIAASLQKPFEEIAELYENKEHIRIKLISASSGTLSTQIRNNAPFDIFISANKKFAEDLVNDKLAVSAEPFCQGSLVWWCKKAIPPEQLKKSIKNGDIRRIAIANPELAPYGMAALDWLKSMDLDTKAKLILGENIGSVNRYIFSNSVDGALTSLSSMHAPELQNNGFWFPLENQVKSDELIQVAVLIRSSTESNKFYNFILSDEVTIILRKYGYLSLQ